MGYATEAAKASIYWAFQNIDTNEILGRAMPNNIASFKVLEKIGLKYVKTIIEKHGQLLIFSIRNVG